MTQEEKRRVNTKKHVYKLIFAKTAFKRVHDTCDYIQREIKDIEHPLYQPLMTAVCVMYAKPFTSNNGVGMLSEKLVKFDDKELSDTHGILMDARNRFYAHTDAGLDGQEPSSQSKFPIQNAYFTVEHFPKGEKLRVVIGTIMSDMRVRPVVLPAIMRLCVTLLSA